MIPESAHFSLFMFNKEAFCTSTAMTSFTSRNSSSTKLWISFSSRMFLPLTHNGSRRRTARLSILKLFLEFSAIFVFWAFFSLLALSLMVLPSVLIRWFSFCSRCFLLLRTKKANYCLINKSIVYIIIGGFTFFVFFSQTQSQLCDDNFFAEFLSLWIFSILEHFASIS